MPNYWYVDSNIGTRADTSDTPYSSKQTGAMSSLGASNVYASLLDVTNGSKTTPPASGDYILIADNHSDGESGFTQLSLPPGVINIVSVDTTAIDTPKVPSGYQFAQNIFKFTGNDARAYIYGVKTHTNYEGINLSNDGMFVDAEDCVFGITGINDIPVKSTNYGVSAIFRNCDLEAYSGYTYVSAQSGCCYEFIGGTFTGSTGPLSDTVGHQGGATLRFDGVDLSALSSHLFAFGSNQATDDYVDIKISNCKLHGSATFNTVTAVKSRSHSLEITNSGTGAAREYQHYQQKFGGYVQDATNYYRNESTAFPATSTKVASKAVTSSLATRNVPFVFELFARYADLTSASTDAITVYFTSSVALTDSDVWFELIYPDATNPETATIESSIGGDPLGVAGSSHTDDSASSTWKDWNGGSPIDSTLGYEYRAVLSTTNGAKCVPKIRVNVGIPSTTIYFDTTIDIS